MLVAARGAVDAGLGRSGRREMKSPGAECAGARRSGGQRGCGSALELAGDEAGQGAVEILVFELLKDFLEESGDE